MSEENKGLLVKVDPTLHRTFKSAASKEGRSMKDVLISLMRMYIDGVERKSRSRRSRG